MFYLVQVSIETERLTPKEIDDLAAAIIEVFRVRNIPVRADNAGEVVRIVPKSTRQQIGH